MRSGRNLVSECLLAVLVASPAFACGELVGLGDYEVGDVDTASARFTFAAAEPAVAMSCSRVSKSPPIAQQRLRLLEDGLVRIELKRTLSDGTVAIDMDPLSLLCRLAASVPPPKFTF